MITIENEQMNEDKFLALLRGINVGGNNIIKMADLKECFESMGFTCVKTYIQSGNVIFGSVKKDKTLLEKQIEETLSKRFNYNSSVFIIDYKQLKQAVTDSPPNFGTEPDKYRSDVLFVKDSLNPKEILKNIKIKEGVDNVWSGLNVIYFSRLISRASQSYLSKIVSMPVYKEITIRNWNTTTKLLALME